MKPSKQDKARKRYWRWYRQQNKNFKGRHDYWDRVLKSPPGMRPLAVAFFVERGIPIGITTAEG
jgi:hypothetical protein